MRETTDLKAERISVSGSLEAVNDLFYRRGWTDGLPIMPPTEDRVQAMLAGTRRPPGEVVAVLPPRWGEANVERIAINSVMAGCLPEYLPVVIAAVEAMAEPPFNLLGVQATTHHCSPLAIVNGPVRHQLGMNSGANAFGGGNRANAAIGRAIRLVLLNVGGGTPGRGDKSTQGHPGKYTFCVAENEEESPWEPLHVERGFPKDTSAVTMVACEAPHHVYDGWSKRAEPILRMYAGTLATPGNSNVLNLGGQSTVAMCPEHAQTIASDGFAKAQARQHIFEAARTPLHWFPQEQIDERFTEFLSQGTVPLTKSPENVLIIVVGGIGKQSSVMPGWGNSYSVTKAIES